MAPAQATNFGVLLKRYRTAAGITQEELAERARIGVHTISDLERGAHRVPHKDTVQQLANALGLSPDDRAKLDTAGRPLCTPSGPQKAVPGAPREGEVHHATVPPLVGRRAELTTLDHHLLTDGGPVLMIAGQPGIGKSRLLHEGMRSAIGYGFNILEGGCQRRSGQEPYAPIVHALAGYLRRLSPGQARSALRDAPWLVRLLPEVAGAVGGVPGPPSEHERRLVFQSVSQFLVNVAGPAGTVLVLDDLQWAGPDAIDLLDALARSASAAPLRIIAAYRDTEINPAARLATMLADLAHAQLARQITISPLALEEAKELLRSVLAETGELRGEIEARIVERTGGVPFFILSYADALQTLGGGRMDSTPWDVAQGIRQRVAAQTETTQEILRTSAVVGREIPLALLVAAVGRRESDVAEALEDARRAQLLVEKDNSTYRFAHDVIREVVEADVGAARRAYLHRRIAEALESLPGHGGPGRVGELAWRFREGNDLRRALRWSIAAGDEAEQVFAHSEAEQFYRSAIGLANELNDRGRELEAQEKLGRVMWLMGRHEEALELLEAVTRAHREAGEDEAEMRTLAALASILSERNRGEDAIERLQFGLERWRHNPVASAGAVSLHSTLATLYRNQGRMDEALEAAHRSVELATALGDPRLLGEAESRLGYALTFVGRTGEALGALSRAIALLDRTGALRLLASTLIHRAVTHENRREYAEAWVDGLRAIDVARRLGDPLTLGHMLAACAWPAWYLDGDWEKARNFLDQLRTVESFLLGTRFSDNVARALWLRLVTGDERTAGRGLKLLIREAEVRGDTHLWQTARLCLAQCELLRGRPHAALEQVKNVPPDTVQSSWGAASAVVETYLACGREEEATTLFDGFLHTMRDLDQQPARGLDRVLWVDVLVAEGLLREAQGRWEDSRAAFEAALEFIREGDGRPVFSHGITTHAYGTLLAQRGETDAGHRLLTKALAIFRGMSACLYTERTERVLAALQHPYGRAASSIG